MVCPTRQAAPPFMVKQNARWWGEAKEGLASRARLPDGRRGGGGTAPKRRSRVWKSGSGGEVDGVEIGPHGAGEDELGVGAFPEEKVAEAPLAAGADQEIHGRGPGALARDVAGEFAHAAGGGQDGVARGVVDCDAEAQAAAVARWRLRPRAMAAQSVASSRSRRPMTSRRTPCATQRAVSLSRYAAMRRMRASTSAGGRRQLSAGEGEEGQDCRLRRRARPPRRGVTASTPARCPAMRGSPRPAAQRPLPSMMIANMQSTL